MSESAAHHFPMTAGSESLANNMTRKRQHSSPCHNSSASSWSHPAGSRASPRIVFGHGTIDRLPHELGRLCVSSPLIASSSSRIALAKQIQTLIPNLNSRILDSAIVGVSSRVLNDVVSRIADCDSVISVGSGSAVDLARAVGLRKNIPHICIPTTYSGSETTPYPGQKTGRKRSRVLPTVIIYDEDLTVSQSRWMPVPSGIAASAHISESRDRGANDDSPWSYIHLPGV